MMVAQATWLGVGVSRNASYDPFKPASPGRGAQDAGNATMRGEERRERTTDSTPLQQNPIVLEEQRNPGRTFIVTLHHGSWLGGGGWI